MSEAPPTFDPFLTSRLQLWKNEGLAAPANELQSIQAWLRCLGEHGAGETARRMRERMLLLMTAASALHAAGPAAEDAAGVYSQVSREEIGVRAAPAGRKPLFYVASRASNPERPQMWVRLRDQEGFSINSTWVDSAAAGLDVDFEVLWVGILAEVASCDCLVLYVAPEDFPLKGAFVEVGIALGLGKPVRIVAPDLALDALDLKPLGSWAKHPLVSFHSAVQSAMSSFTL